MEPTYITSEEFERWLALQLNIGWKVRNPESVEKIREAFRKGAKLAPFREIPQDDICEECGNKAPNIIGCPDGAEICQACFDAGNH